jgi:hypothetical protein
MTYELFNPSTTISRKFSKQSWVKALELAMMNGWRPKGTHPPHHDFHLLNAEWPGIYLTNDSQIVTREDAFSLAVALEHSLCNIPDTNIKADWNLELWTEDDLPEWLSPEEKEIIDDGMEEEMLDIMGIDPYEFFRGDDKQILTSLMRFCRLGSFIIT